MSPAEITQQLGLQSLTRRAWVRIILSIYYVVMHVLTFRLSTSNLPALPPVTVSTKVLSG